MVQPNRIERVGNRDVLERSLAQRFQESILYERESREPKELLNLQEAQSRSELIYMMQGCHTPPPPPPAPWYPPLPVKWVVVLFGLVAFPVWSCLASSPLPPPPGGVGPVVFLVGPAPFYRRMVWLLPLVSSNVIVTCLVPSPPFGVGPVVVLVGPAPPVWGSVFYKDMYGMVAAAC